MLNAHKKIFYIILAAIFVGIGILFLAEASKSEPVFAENQITNFASPLPVFSNIETSQDFSESKKINDEITLKVGDGVYVVSVAKESSVYDAMTILSSLAPSFTFKAREYPGLGYLIEEINGVKNAGGKYWTLYVNGKYSTVGASNYKLMAGDKAEWRYEKN